MSGRTTLTEPWSNHRQQHAAPDVSIVVCTYNRADMLADALASLCRLQTEDRFRCEIVVVDNASTDDTAEVVAQLEAACPFPLRYVRETKQGIVPARNRGVAEATGKWMAFFDDDQLADPRWLLALWDLAHVKGAQCLGGPVELHLPAGCKRQLLPTVRMLLGESNWSSTPEPYDEKFCPGTGNMLVERQWVVRVGGFDDAVGSRGEDTDLYLRLRQADCKAWYVPAAVVKHVMTAERLSDAYILRLAHWMGGSVAQKEQRVYGSALFAVRYLAKLARLALVQLPALTLARLSKEPERILETRCQVAIARAYAVRGWQLLGCCCGSRKGQ